MKHTIKPFGRSFGIIALLVVALVFSFAVLVSCGDVVNGKDAEKGSEITIDENGYWRVDGQLQYKEGDNPATDLPIRAYMSYPDQYSFNNNPDGLAQTYGNVKPITIVPLDQYGMLAEDITVRYDKTGGPTSNGKYPLIKYVGIEYPSGSGKFYGYTEQVYINLAIGTYPIYLDVRGRNGYYFPEGNIRLGDVTLTVSKVAPTASDYALVTAVPFKGDAYDAADILGGKDISNAGGDRLGLPVPANVKFKNNAPNGAEYTTKVRNAGVYTVTFDALATEKWLAASGRLTMANTFTINQGIPENGQYVFKLDKGDGIFIDQVDQEAYDTAILPLVAQRNSGVLSSEASVAAARYSGTSPAWGPDSPDVPNLPGTFTVTFAVEASMDGNWAAGTLGADPNDLINFVITAPSRTSIADFKTWLGLRLQINPPDLEKFYEIKLDVSDLEGDFSEVDSVGYILLHYGNAPKNVFLDLSGASLTTIEKEAFDGCTNLVGIVLPTDSLTKIEEEAFAYTNIKKVTIPASVTVIETLAFASCPRLAEVTFNGEYGNVTIGDHAFIGNLAQAYAAGGAGRYTLVGEIWTKQ